MYMIDCKGYCSIPTRTGFIWPIEMVLIREIAFI